MRTGELPQRFEQHHASGRGQIEAAHATAVLHRSSHRDRQGGVGLSQHGFRQASGFAPEQQPVVMAEADAVIRLVGMTGECQQAPATLPASGQKGVPIGMAMQLNPGPVIQPCATQRPVADLKTQRFDQMQFRAGGRAGSGNIAGIRWNFRLEQNQAGRCQTSAGTSCPSACRSMARPATTNQLPLACCISRC